MEMGKGQENDDIKQMDWSSDEDDNKPFGGNNNNNDAPDDYFSAGKQRVRTDTTVM